MELGKALGNACLHVGRALFGARDGDTIEQDSKLFIVNRVGVIIESLIRWGFLTWIFLGVSKNLAGKETNVLVNMIVDTAQTKPVQYAAFFILVVTVFVQRRTYSKRIAKISDQKQELELIMDKRRSSSGLAANGENPNKRMPRDKG